MMTTAAEEYTASSAHRFHHQLINEKEYLFRLSSTFAWEESIEFCNTCIFHVERAAAAAALLLPTLIITAARLNTMMKIHTKTQTTTPVYTQKYNHYHYNNTYNIFNTNYIT